MQILLIKEYMENMLKMIWEVLRLEWNFIPSFELEAQGHEATGSSDY